MKVVQSHLFLNGSSLAVWRLHLVIRLWLAALLSRFQPNYR